MLKFKFTVLCISILSFSNVAMAVDYTSKRAKKPSVKPPEYFRQNPSNYNKEKKCDRNDMRLINHMNKKAKRKIEKHKELEEDTKNVRTPEDAAKFTKEMKKINDFFESDDFKTMDKIYKRCKVKIPKVEHEPLFWVPIDKEKQEQQNSI